MLARYALAFLAAALLLAGCNPGASSGELVEVTRRVQRGVTPGQRTLVFDSYNGSITLWDTTAREADLTFVKRARAESREEARELLDEIRIEERGGEGEFAYRLASGASGRTSVEVRGSVPRRTRLRLHLRNGEVALSGLQGPLDVNNENGDVRIGGAGAATRAETRNGAVEVGMRRVPPEAEVRLRSSNGSLELTLPATTSADVEARTDAGEITVSGLNFEDRELNQSAAGARFQGELGDGAATVRLRTQNGSIALRQGTVRRLPGVEGDTSRAARPDTTGLDSLFTPPPGTGGGTGGQDTGRDTAGQSGTGLLGPQRQPPSTGIPPLLQRPQPRPDTSRPPAPVPGIPSLQSDTTQMR